MVYDVGSTTPPQTISEDAESLLHREPTITFLYIYASEILPYLQYHVRPILLNMVTTERLNLVYVPLVFTVVFHITPHSFNDLCMDIVIDKMLSITSW